MSKDHTKTFQDVSLTLDVGCIIGAFAAAVFLRTYQSRIPFQGWIPEVTAKEGIGWSADYLSFLLLSLLLWIAVMKYAGVYHSHRAERLSSIVRIYLQAAVLCGLGAGFMAFAFKLGSISRLFTFYFFSLAFLFLVGKQISIISFLHHLHRKGDNTRKVLIYGHKEQAVRFTKKVEEAQESSYRVVQVITDRELMSQERSHPLTALRIVSSEIDEVFFVLSGRGMSDFEQILALLLLKQGKKVHLVPSLFDMGLFRQSVTDFAGMPILSLGGTGLDEVQALGKRVLDVVGAVVLSILLCPVFVVVAVLVKLTSPGPVLFVQERLGRTGKRFHLYKFRTMRADAEHLLRSNPQLYEKYVANNYKLLESEDPRITPIGRFLRKASLDELPQLLNVLKGDMSLVGPRPIVPPEIEKYGDYAPLFLSVKPGLTGYWQVNGRSSVDYPLRAELDLEYVRDQSFKMDVDILLKTIPAVMWRKGAY